MSNSTSNANQSVRVLQRVLVKARYLAIQGDDAKRLVGILDWAELLAGDLAEPDDHFRQFSDHLQGLGEDYPEFAGILADFRRSRPESTNS